MEGIITDSLLPPEMAKKKQPGLIIVDRTVTGKYSYCIRLNSLSTPRDNMAIREICQTLNDYETVFPGTNLKLFFKTATVEPARGQEF